MVEGNRYYGMLFNLAARRTSAVVDLVADRSLTVLLQGTTQTIALGNKVQVYAVYVSILADIFVTAYTDTLHTTEVLAIILLLRYARC